jgi:hypothetical protein
MTTALRAMTQLVTWPDLSEVQPRCGIGRALRSADAEIAHFHSGWSVDLRLTADVIRRLQDELKNSTAIRLVPDSHWVTIRLEGNSDIDLLMTLMSVALQADQAWPHMDDALSAWCNNRCGMPG